MLIVVSVRTTHLHLDPVGGIAGDMFVGALLDLDPSLAEATFDAIRDAGLDEAVSLRHEPFSDGILSGSRFEVGAPAGGLPDEHVHRSRLRRRLSESRLQTPVRERAVDIFQHLARAEARVHGVDVDEVAFHEVGAWDSIADIVAAANVIESVSPCTWSVGPIPIGSGRVDTRHGKLPVPAPATTILLAGFRCFDDGIPGERVTPTGAAILRHLEPAHDVGAIPRRLQNTGYGFGRRRFDALSNVLRVLQFADQAESVNQDRVSVVRFEVDDQTAEDLAIGLDRIRDVEGVIDVAQMSLTGKQGRLASGIQVLARPEFIDVVTTACFRQTTTLGLRVQTTDRLILERRETSDSRGLTVKVAERPSGRTAKADVQGVVNLEGHSDRQASRRAAELEVLGGPAIEQ